MGKNNDGPDPVVFVYLILAMLFFIVIARIAGWI